jgi:hypothetical protein
MATVNHLTGYDLTPSVLHQAGHVQNAGVVVMVEVSGDEPAVDRSFRDQWCG